MNAGRRPVEVLKLGGSLFDLPGLRERVLAECRDGFASVIVPGGGRFVDVIRGLSPALGPPSADVEAIEHNIALASTRVSAMWTAAALRLPLLDSIPAIDGLPPVGVLPAAAAPREGLPEVWEVTSDVLAWRVAEQLRAERLTLLKSVGPFASLAEAASRGAVDRPFVEEADADRVRWRNLRNA